MKLPIGKRAQQQADEIEAWWIKNRPAAPTLFTVVMNRTRSSIAPVSAVLGR